MRIARRRGHQEKRDRQDHRPGDEHGPNLTICHLRWPGDRQTEKACQKGTAADHQQNRQMWARAHDHEIRRQHDGHAQTQGRADQRAPVELHMLPLAAHNGDQDATQHRRNGQPCGASGRLTKDQPRQDRGAHGNRGQPEQNHRDRRGGNGQTEQKRVEELTADNGKARPADQMAQIAAPVPAETRPKADHDRAHQKPAPCCHLEPVHLRQAHQQGVWRQNQRSDSGQGDAIQGMTFHAMIQPGRCPISGKTMSASAANSSCPAMPVKTPTVCMPAARPAIRSWALSPTITTRSGASPMACAKAKSGPGAGLAPCPESNPAMKSKCAATPALCKWLRAPNSESLVITPSLSPRAESPSRNGAKGTAGAKGAWLAWIISTCSICSTASSGRACATQSAASRFVPAMTKLVGLNRPAPRSKSMAWARRAMISCSPSAKWWITSAAHAFHVAPKSNKVPSLSNNTPSTFIDETRGAAVMSNSPAPRPAGPCGPASVFPVTGCAPRKTP